MANKFDSITITSDGTKAGTVIQVNGKEVKGLGSLHLMFWNDSYDNNVHISYSVESGGDPGTLKATTYYSVVPPQANASASIQESPAMPPEHAPRGGRKLYAQIG
jgi:hypothetical protein